MTDSSDESPKNGGAKLDRIVAARMKLRARFERAQDAAAKLDDARAAEQQGTGPTNRHGAPRLPPGQTETKKWPVLDLGNRPSITRADWHLRVDGAVEAPLTLDFDALSTLAPRDDVSDFHCVTTWSKFDMSWRGTRVSDVLALTMPDAKATHILCYGSDGYTTNLPLAEALRDDVLLTWEVDGSPLSAEHGGPVRMITPQLYAWKGSKWIRRIEVLLEDKQGFWERRGYSKSAFPWTNDRYE